MLVRPLADADRAWKRQALVEVWGSTEVARTGALVDALPLPGFVAVDGQERLGLLTYRLEGDALEVVTVQVVREGRGVGRMLLDAARAQAERMGLARMWLMTTDDNTRAIRFYERWGMQLVERIEDGVAASRAVKPSIPLVNAAGIPVRDELRFELHLLRPR